MRGFNMNGGGWRPVDAASTHGAEWGTGLRPFCLSHLYWALPVGFCVAPARGGVLSFRLHRNEYELRHGRGHRLALENRTAVRHIQLTVNRST